MCFCSRGQPAVLALAPGLQYAALGAVPGGPYALDDADAAALAVAPPPDVLAAPVPGTLVAVQPSRPVVAAALVAGVKSQTGC